MTRKSYDTLQGELSAARMYIDTLIHDTVYGVVNAHAYPHEYTRIKDAARFMAVVRVSPDHNPNKIKRCIHQRHPGVILIALPAHPIENYFICILAYLPESWCIRVKAAMNKAHQKCTMSWTPTTGNPVIDFMTCFELIQLTNTEEPIQ